MSSSTPMSASELRPEVSAISDLHAGRDPLVVGVIVTYHPNFNLRKNVAALRPQVGDLVIVDNGSGNDSRSSIAEIASALQCHVIFNDTNLGIAAALNLGVAYANEKRCTFVALFDQDSRVTDSFIGSMLNTYKDYSGATLPAIVAPIYIDEKSSLPIPMSSNKERLMPTSMTSGSLIPMSTFQQCGLFEEPLFIDCVDTEFSLRVRANGLVILQSDSATLIHSLGNVRVHHIVGKKATATNHSASRRYYISRNRMILYRRYLRSRPEWVMLDVWAMMKDTIKIVLIEDDRMRKLSCTMRGIWDGIIGRTGYRVPL